MELLKVHDTLQMDRIIKGRELHLSVDIKYIWQMYFL